ncbi:MAG: GspE/PulE family protein [Planctomycetota bacterium]|nr:GspE/PulE family protein [Planctomycetota bacterium]
MTEVASHTDEERSSLPSEAFLRLIPRDFARQHLILSEGHYDGVEYLAVAERSDPAAVFNVGVRLGTAIEPVVRDEQSVAEAIDTAYASVQDNASVITTADPAEDSTDVERLLQLADRDLLSTEGKGPVVKLVDAIVFEALGRGASDIHVQPLADRTLVRYRLDGVLQTVREVTPKLTPAIVSRIKVMGRMDIAERRIPQDGRATVVIGSGRSIDLRISTLPTSYGERAVVRLLDVGHGPGLDDFASLGMPERVESRFLHCAGRASGIVLVTGPTGSGKTTTLYTTLRWLATRNASGNSTTLHGNNEQNEQNAQNMGGGLNIMTIEDPIEYELATSGIAISQSQVNTRKGITFASGLRHILRQDPDVIMVGEIRDAETARIAIQASLTGHLVFSTLHTNDAPSAVTRLLDLGVEPYLVASSVSTVLAQRLLRLTHQQCNGNGCGTCLHAGYRGRTAIFELITVDDELRALVTGGESASSIRQHVRSQGVRSLEQEADALVEAGLTTRTELERVVGGLG